MKSFSDQQWLDVLLLVFAYRDKCGYGWKQLQSDNKPSRSTLYRYSQLAYDQQHGVIETVSGPNGQKKRATGSNTSYRSCNAWACCCGATGRLLVLSNSRPI